MSILGKLGWFPLVCVVQVSIDFDCLHVDVVVGKLLQSKLLLLFFCCHKHCLSDQCIHFASDCVQLMMEGSFWVFLSAQESVHHSQGQAMVVVPCIVEFLGKREEVLRHL